MSTVYLLPLLRRLACCQFLNKSNESRFINFTVFWVRLHHPACNLHFRPILNWLLHLCQKMFASSRGAPPVSLSTPSDQELHQKLHFDPPSLATDSMLIPWGMLKWLLFVTYISLFFYNCCITYRSSDIYIRKFNYLYYTFQMFDILYILYLSLSWQLWYEY